MKAKEFQMRVEDALSAERQGWVEIGAFGTAIACNDLITVLKSPYYKELLNLATVASSKSAEKFSIPKNFFDDLSFPLSQRTLDELTGKKYPEEKLFCEFYKALLEEQEKAKIVLKPSLMAYANGKHQAAKTAITESKQKLIQRKTFLENQIHTLENKMEFMQPPGLFFGRNNLLDVQLTLSSKRKKLEACNEIIGVLTKTENSLPTLLTRSTKDEIDLFLKEQQRSLASVVNKWVQEEEINFHEKTGDGKGEFLNQLLQKLTFGLIHYSTATKNELDNTSNRIKTAFRS